MSIIGMYQESWRQLPPETRRKWENSFDAMVPPTLLLDLVGSQMELDGYVPQTVADSIICDSMLTARLLAAANSAEASPTKPVTAVRQALVMLGFFSVRMITINYLLEQMYSKVAEKNPQYVKFLQQWLSGASIIAFHWMKTANLENTDTISTAALLSRIGSLLMAQSSDLSSQYISSGDELWRSQYEMEKYSVAAPLLSAEQIRRWGLPETLISLVARQRYPLEHQVTVGSDEAQQTILAASLPLSELLISNPGSSFEMCLQHPSYFVLSKNINANGLISSLEKVWVSKQLIKDISLAKNTV